MDVVADKQLQERPTIFENLVSIDRPQSSILSRFSKGGESLSNQSAAIRESSGADGEKRAFELFTHHKKDRKGKLKLTYEDLHLAVLELYLSVRIRSDEEIDAYDARVFDLEKQEMNHIDGFTLIDYIKSSVEILMHMKQNESLSSGAKRIIEK